MIKQNAFLTVIITLGLFSCTEKTEPDVKDNVEVSSESNEEVDQPSTDEPSILEKIIPTVVSFDKKSKFTITAQNAGLNENTGTENIDVFLSNAYFDAPIKLTQELSYSELAPGEGGIPAFAAFGFSTWFAGGGELVYGIVNDGTLQIYHKFEDEQSENLGEFTLLREIDPNVGTDKPSYYISYTADDESTNDLMIACDERGKGLYAKYDGQSRHIKLQFLKDESEGRNTVEYFNEIVKEEITGTYKMMHSGNYDYVEYTNKKSGKKYSFTINFEETIINDTYRTTPNF